LEKSKSTAFSDTIQYSSWKMSQIYLKRLTKELKEFQVAPPPGTALLDAESLQWYVSNVHGMASCPRLVYGAF
jgi:hypothetical protein